MQQETSCAAGKKHFMMKTGQTIHYKGRKFRSLKGRGFKSNYYDVDTGEEYWITGCKRNGKDRLYAERVPIEIDEDVCEEYWTLIREQPENKLKRFT